MSAKNLGTDLRRLVERAMKEFQVPGVAVGISHEGKDRYFAYGVTNVDFPRPVEPETLFMIGSTTKTFTGTVVMRLVEEGKLDLSAPVVRYLPRFKVPDSDASAKVTVDHLVTHTSGWMGDYFDDLGRGADATSKIVARMARRTPQLTPLGTVWSYNNAGFYVLGLIIEKLTKRSYEDVVKDWVFGPLGMERSFFFAEEVMTRPHVLGHAIGKEGPEVMRPWGLSRGSVAAGGIVSNAPDQLRYARFHMGRLPLEQGIRPPIGPESVATMQLPRAKAGGLAEEVGVTWLLEGSGRRRIVGHGGSINGQMSAFKMIPSVGLAVTVLTNGNLGAAVGALVCDHVLAELGGVTAESPRRRLGKGAAHDYVGRYRGDPGHLIVAYDDGALVVSTELRPELLEANPELVLQLPRPARYRPVGPDRFMAELPTSSRRLEFIRGEDGSVAWMRHGGRIRPVWRRTTPA
jgi:CubicO group peptidase (beta-lactamase class C family)